MEQHSTKATTNNNNRQLAGPDALSKLIHNEVLEAVEAAVNRSLHFQVQCVTVDEAAKIIGVIPDTIRQYIKRKNNPLIASKPGKDYLIRLKDLNKFLDECRTNKNPLTIKHKTKAA